MRSTPGVDSETLRRRNRICRIVHGKNSNFNIAAGLALAIFLWGGNNAATKWLVQSWPPVAVGGTRFLCAGLLMVGLLRWTSWFGGVVDIPRDVSRRLWLRTGLSLAVYIVCFNWAMRLTSASHVTLYLGASPVWALLWEERPRKSWQSLRRYGAALFALAGAATLFWPALRDAKTNLYGEMLALVCSVLWTVYGRECRSLGARLPGAEIAAQTMWRSGVWLLPLSVLEVGLAPQLDWNVAAVGVQIACIFFGGVVAYGLWNNALRFWPASRVLLFNNLIPVSTMAWAHFTLGETVTRTFWMAMLLIVAGVALGQSDLLRCPDKVLPPE
jgi:drug/metabolite transporter (DMT)-like permease